MLANPRGSRIVKRIARRPVLYLRVHVIYGALYPKIHLPRTPFLTPIIIIFQKHKALSARIKDIRIYINTCIFCFLSLGVSFKMDTE